MPRLTDKQRRERAEVEKLRERYDKQEAKRAVRIQIDQNRVLWVVIALVAVTFLGSAVLVANGTFAVSSFIRFPEGFEALGWLVFAGVEVTVVWSLLTYLILGSRGESARAWFGVMLGYATLTILTNAFHTLEAWDFVWVEPRMWAGVALASAVPVAFTLATKALSRVVFAKAIRLEQ